VLYDFKAISATVDLRQLIAADVGPPDRFGNFDCPFCGEGKDRPPWCGEEAALQVGPTNRSFFCRDCHAKGDALDWVTRRMDIGIVEAARKLVPDLERFRKPDPPRPTPPARWQPHAKSKARPQGRKFGNTWDADRAWKFRTFKLAESLIKTAGIPPKSAWAEARGTVAELRRAPRPEAAWHEYLDSNPPLKGLIGERRVSRSLVGS